VQACQAQPAEKWQQGLALKHPTRHKIEQG